MTDSKGGDDLINTSIKKKFKKGLFKYGQDIIMAFSPPAVCCLVKKGLQKGVSRAPQDPPGYAYVLERNWGNRTLYSNNYI